MAALMEKYQSPKYMWKYKDPDFFLTFLIHSSLIKIPFIKIQCNFYKFANFNSNSEVEGWFWHLTIRQSWYRNDSIIRTSLQCL